MRCLKFSYILQSHNLCFCFLKLVGTLLLLECKSGASWLKDIAWEYRARHIMCCVPSLAYTASICTSTLSCHHTFQIHACYFVIFLYFTALFPLILFFFSSWIYVRLEGVVFSWIWLLNLSLSPFYSQSIYIYGATLVLDWVTLKQISVQYDLQAFNNVLFTFSLMRCSV